mmetsp:Transcript_10792/g.10690  ORF Transcript_10792/g.10690 Transcript_10792/m.10690 type:complete len:100 (-) Transcript_10792:665-964(-)
MLAERIAAHERKKTDIWNNKGFKGDTRQSFLTRHVQGTIPNPMMVTNGINNTHRHTKSKEVLIKNDRRLAKPITLKSQKSYKNIYPNPMSMNARNTNQS